MSEIYTDSVQNRFTAYLQAAVTNKRIRYFEKKKQQREREQIQVDMLEKGHSDFDAQFIIYKKEQEAHILEEWEKLSAVLALVENNRLIKEICRLKEKEQRLLFAKVFGELSFQELGERFGMEPKQAEMAYYYIIRKIRKRLEGWKDEF